MNYGWFSFRKGKISGKAWVVKGTYSRFAFETDVPEIKKLLDAVTASTFNATDSSFPEGYIYSMGLEAAKAQGYKITGEHPLKKEKDQKRIH